LSPRHEEEEARMRLYCGIDLHSNNVFVVVLDEHDRVVQRCRLPNDLAVILPALEPHRAGLVGIAVESTFNWYWLVDGLMDAGHRVHLANPAAMQRYSGLKHVDDPSDACWLAHMLRIGVLPEGYIYPREQRGLRDLLRRRTCLVQQRTAMMLSLGNQVQRSTGKRPSVRRLEEMDLEPIGDANVTLAAEATRRILECVTAEVERLEKEVWRQLRADPLFGLLNSVAGVGKILAPTIRLETGEIGRFAEAGHYVSYCRCVGSRHISNGKTKGQGNTKNGNPYLAWAWLEAAHFAIRYYPAVRRFYERKQARTHRIVALKAVAHKLARAGYYVMRDRVPFRIELAFG
jgi:transposase